MLGAIPGDIVGSVYEGSGLKRADFPLFGPGCEAEVFARLPAELAVVVRAFRERYGAR